MSLYCADGARGEFVKLPSAPPPERRAGKVVWRPPDASRDRCGRCGAPAMEHTAHPPERAA